MMHRMILLLGLLGCVGMGVAQITQLGQCETINYMNGFVLDTFLNTWYEVGSSSSQNADCISWVFTSTANGITVSNPAVVNNFLQTSTGTATHTANTPQLTLTMSSPSNSINFGILNTDYTNYAIAIECENLGPLQRSVNVWQLGRATDSYATAATLQMANTALGTIGLSVNDLQSIDHSTAACTQLPVIPTGQPVILPGQCNNDMLNVQPNIQVGDFQGTWHEISSYYSVNAIGTCARADYTLVGTTVEVVNSQVLNQRLDTITGTASLIGTNDEGRLSVLLNVPGVPVPVEQELLILATNYDGYAVSYTCVDLGDNERQVNSWILSRSRQITPESQIEVNRVINSYVDLNTAYFQETQQTDDACFYYPEAVSGRPVIFPGQCDETISAMSPFNLASFVGDWYEVEAYPKEQQTGTCVNHDFTAITGNSNTLNLVSNQVINQFAASASGSVSFESNDGSGKLRLRMIVNGREIDFPYWILSTNYNSYALVYSCENIMGTDFRMVHSWKLSRSQTLQPNDVTLINNAMAAVQVLDQDYFDPIDQSAAACSTLPPIPAGQPVILPGRCNNDNINVKQNFQVGDFVGTWHEISSYYSVNAIGTCARADYTLVGSTVEVVNSQVLNQRLDTITGTATLIGTNDEGRLNVVLNVQGNLVPQELLILDTDYNGYAVSYTCVDLPNGQQRQVNSWILSRSRQITPASQTEVNRVINSYFDLNAASYQSTAQTDDACFYYPEAVSGRPVIFPGQCDETISAMSPFNLASFVGDWYEVEAYPKEQQTGTCVNHDFTAITGNPNTLNLVSNQVINQFAASASGSVSFESNDGSGKLRLRMIVNGREIDFPYWILSTNYNSYALVYSCENMGTDFRMVHSWKLSRSQTLQPNDVTLINNAMAAVQVLDQDYFDPIDQSAAACSTLPPIPAGQPVILPGRCNNDNINVKQNFQVGDFVGTWHEISSYYSVNAIGTCARADYTLVGSTVEVVNSQVLNQRLDTITGTATLIGTNDEGRLNVVLNVQGNLVPQELLILDTDYNGYAVSYTCVDLPNGQQRQVNSWILSRSRQITPASQTEVNRVINSYFDLNAASYQSTAQTDDACFYYPEAVSGQPVIFPGQCDETIIAMNPFNLASFVGDWYEVEAYPKEQQTGTCVNHDFTAITGNPNTLNLVSNQVINQFAASASGSVSFESNDGSGKLRLRMIVNGREIDFPYWILSTNYNSYALVYSCENMGTDFRMVHSWKLSRSQTLQPNDVTLINNAMAAVQVLDQDYFDPIDQSAAACSTLPPIPAGQPVILPGRCNNDNINVKQNFQVGDFVGTWHEISSYYSVNAIGTCARADYTLVGSTVEVVNSQVLNQRLDTITGTATLIGTNDEGRLNVVLNVQGNLVPQELLILDTDYNGYAVSYTCVDLPNGQQRQVNSWILSRSRQITPASQTEVNRVINSYFDLNAASYQSTAQTDDACFYYPEAVSGQPVIFPGQCDETIIAMNPFNLASFVGDWYEVEAYPKEQQTGTCVNHDFTAITGNPNTLNLVSNQVINQFAASASGSVSFESNDGSGKLRLRMIVNGREINFPYWILSTNYNSYALVYSCENMGTDFRMVHSWKLSRSQTLQPNDVTLINNAMAAVQVLDQDYFDPIDQSAAACSTLPPIPAGQPVILPGQCNNDNIYVKQNFQVGDFVGTWHEISSYYSENAIGTCARADYTLVGTTVEVVNSQVLNQRLDTITGTATLIGTNNEGRLNVVLNVQGTRVTQELLILDTDYNGYAVSYTCVDLPNGQQRQVNSWILSKSRQITPASQTEVNRVINSYFDLNAASYQSTAQTDDACFYYPEAVSGRPVVFPGQCDETISAMSSFNLASFAGTWHEVEAYPKEQQTGTCVNHDFTVVAGDPNTLSLVSNQVVNQLPTSASGSVTFESTDGTGKLRLNMIVNGQPIEIPYWILSTNYNSYALVYSCMKIDDDYRSVHSWKLSRTQTLQPGDLATINNAMEAVQVLDQDYFEDIDQSADVCSVYNIPEGDPIILPGQCPPVTAVPNFQPNSFPNNWYEVASYPSEAQSGTCSRVEYNIVDGVITLDHNMVVEGKLQKQMGTASLDFDGTGVLDVIYVLENEDGDEKPEISVTYYILATDYASYALVYSCRNLTDATRQVFSWKLSTEPELDQAANDAINAAISNTDGLFGQYYRDTEQTADACFYEPEPKPGQSVLFRGACQPVNGMDAFNAAEYLGWWHEIERYPTDEKLGQCTSARFTQTGATIQVVQTNIDDGDHSETTSTAVLSDAATITITTDGEDIVWTVIDTDYNTYSLLYACQNVDTDWGVYRRVWSAKHSKSRSLTPEANNAMNTYIDANPVLVQNLYENVDQSNDACFHYRAPPVSQVILDGLCDPDIPYQTEFDVARFAGTWYQHARYPYPEVDNEGTCVGARYTVNGDNINVQNWEVLDGELNTIEGTATADAATATLTVTLEGVTDTMDLRILTTDYDNYALAYTCRNRNPYQRYVGAFKLSRNRVLNDAAQTAINDYMRDRREFYDDYFIPIEHNAECVQPSSAFLAKSSIIAMLVCIALQLVM